MPSVCESLNINQDDGPSHPEREVSLDSSLASRHLSILGEKRCGKLLIHSLYEIQDSQASLMLIFRPSSALELELKMVPLVMKLRSGVRL